MQILVSTGSAGQLPLARWTRMLFLSTAAAVPPLAGYTPATLLSVPKTSADFSCTFRHARLCESASLRKAAGESIEHLLLKALVWALYLPAHPSAVCEPGPLSRLDVYGGGLPFHPDVVALTPSGEPTWWAECGSVSVRKLEALSRAHPRSRFTIAKWGRSDLRGYAAQLRASLPADAAGRFEVISWPADAPERCIDQDGAVHVSFDDLLDREVL